MCCHYKYRLHLSKRQTCGYKFLAKSKTLEKKRSDWTAEQGVLLPLIERSFISFQSCGKQLPKNLQLNKVFIFWLKTLWPVCFQPNSMVQIFVIWPLLEPFISRSIVFIVFYLKIFLTWFTWRKLAGKICGLADLWRPHLHYCVTRPQTPDTNFLSYPHHLNFGSCYTEDKTLGLLGSKALQPSFFEDYQSEYSLSVQYG